MHLYRLLLLCISLLLITVNGQQQLYTSSTTTQGGVSYQTGIATTSQSAIYNIQLIPVASSVISAAIIHYTVTSSVNANDVGQQNVYTTQSNGQWVYPVQLHPADLLDYSFTFFDANGAAYNTATVEIQTAAAPTATTAPTVTTKASVQATQSTATTAAPVQSSTQNGNVGGIYYTTSVVTSGNTASIQLSVSPTGTQLSNVIIHYSYNGAQQNVYMSLQGNIYTKQVIMSTGTSITYSFTLFATTGPAYDTNTISYTLSGATTSTTAPTTIAPTQTATKQSTVATTTLTPTTVTPTTSTGTAATVGGTGVAGGLTYAYSVSNTGTKQFSINFQPESGTCDWAIVHFTVNGAGATNVGMYSVSNGFAYATTLNTGDLLQYSFTFDITNGAAYDTPVYAYTAGSSSTTGQPSTTATTAAATTLAPTTQAVTTTVRPTTTAATTTVAPTTKAATTTAATAAPNTNVTTGSVLVQNEVVSGVSYSTSIAFETGNTAIIQFTPNPFSSVAWVNLHYTISGGGAYNVAMTVYNGNSYSFTVSNLAASGGVTYSFTFWSSAAQAAYDSPTCTYAYGTLTCEAPVTTTTSTSTGSTSTTSTSSTTPIVSITPQYPSTAPLSGAIVQPTQNVNTATCPWLTYDITFAQWYSTATVASNGNYRLTGQRVLLQSSVTLNAPLQILNGGSLIFDNANIALTVPSIVMELGGALIMGSSTCPFVKNANIFISGSATSTAMSVDYDYSTVANQGYAVLGGEPNPSSFGNRVIGVGSGGTISLHGSKGVRAYGGVSWTYLAQTANVGDTVIYVDGTTVDWTAGDYIVIATTDFEPDHTETGLIQSITGNTITLASPIQYQHWGQLLNYDGRTVNLRAEVALLSRNIQIQPVGVVNDTLPGYGGHMMFRRGFTSVQVQGVQLFQFGQGGVMGRYAIHFHLCVNTASNTYVVDNSIWDSQTRWITIHGSNNVFVQGNVGFLSFGAGYFFEDGVETGNIIDHNVGMVPRPAATNYFWNPYNIPPLSNFDQLNPTVFWITNMYNTITNNAAVGASAVGRGFWLVGCPAKGQSAALWSSDFQYIPYSNGINSPLYKFSANTAHGCFLGIDTVPPPDYSNVNEAIINPDIAPYSETMFSDYFGLYDPQLANGNNLISIINNCTVYRSRGAQTFAAVWLRPYWFWVNNSVLADNLMGYMTMVSAGDPSGVAEGFYGVSSNNLYIGFSESAAQWEPFGSMQYRTGSVNTVTGSGYPSQMLMEKRGHQFYDGPAHIYNASFHNFYPTPHPLGTLAPGSTQPIQVNNTAIGWFLPNVYLYPAAFTSNLARFTNCTIRHFVYSQQIADSFGQGLLDGDKQTFLLDVDGTLTGASMSTSINDYIFNRGPEYVQECQTQSTCMTSPVSYLNGHLIVYNNNSVTQAASVYNEANNETLTLNGVNTGNIRQFFLLSMKQNRYQITVSPTVNLMYVRLLYADQNDYVDFDFCVGQLSLSQISVTIGTLANNAYTGNPQTGFTANSSQAALTWSYSNGNIYVRAIQTEPKSTTCYPVGACVPSTTPGVCQYNSAVANITGCSDLASCNWMCATYGSGYSDCPAAGCPTVQVSITGSFPSNPTCSTPYNPYGLALRQTTLTPYNNAIDSYFPTQCTGTAITSTNQQYSNSFSTGAFNVTTAAGDSVGLYGNYTTALSIGLTPAQAIQTFGVPTFIQTNTSSSSIHMKTVARTHMMKNHDLLRLTRRSSVHY